MKFMQSGAIGLIFGLCAMTVFAVAQDSYNARAA